MSFGKFYKNKRQFDLHDIFSLCRHWLERKLVISPSAAVVARSSTWELR